VRTIALIFILVSINCLAQKDSSGSSLLLRHDTIKAKEIKKNPKHATLLSTVLPGAGQVYNQKYWKVPVIYAAFVGLGYIFKINEDGYKQFDDEYRYRLTHVDPSGVEQKKDLSLTLYTDDNLLTVKNDYERYRNLAVIGMAAIYVLNIVDAAVDAHMFTFDVSDNLSLRIQPSLLYTAQNNLPKTGIGISLKF